uniref:Uncharacterized protein n=1 Tax=Knipowitschia caucasica TaxID=637954 RepID=A0AAV2JFW3_KNICA
MDQLPHDLGLVIESDLCWVVPDSFVFFLVKSFGLLWVGGVRCLWTGVVTAHGGFEVMFMGLHKLLGLNEGAWVTIHDFISHLLVS